MLRYPTLCARFTILFVAVMLASCSGGKGSHATAKSIIKISIVGTNTPLWVAPGGAPTDPQTCQTGIALNAPIAFDFDGTVDPNHVPQSGLALGSISITTVDVTTQTSVAAIGQFLVQDDPTMPAGNNRRVTFVPSSPATIGQLCGAGLYSNATYQIFVPQGGNSPDVLFIDAKPISNFALACFTTCGCPTASPQCSTFVDPVPGAPFVAGTIPTTANPATGPIDPCAIADNTVTLLFNEPINPAGVDLEHVKILDAATGAQVPGYLEFFQANAGPTPTPGARINYRAARPFVAGRTYEIVVSSLIVDFGGNGVTLAAGDPSARRFLATTATAAAPQAPITESFDDIANRAVTSGECEWDGTGQLTTTFPTLLTGDGSDPPLTPVASANLDTASPATRHGFFNFPSVAIPAGVTLRVVGPYKAHIRCTGNVVINGTLDASAGTSSAAVLGTPDQGARAGALNNGGGISCIAKGGVGNAGAGDGGDGSPGACAVRAVAGESGYGPRLATGAPGLPGAANLLYAGGAGGRSGCFPVISGCSAGDLGGIGGAGGTAGTTGESGRPRANTTLCGLVSPITPPVSAASPVSPLMVPPIAEPSAGSGGGGGGDHIDGAGASVQTDDQGGGGGGGGGSIRITCVGSYTQGAGSQIRCAGAPGAIGAVLSGAGGSGSGGEIWIQAFATVSIATTATMNVDGPARVGAVVNQQGCSNQAAGGGGKGLIQIEAGSGAVPTGFTIVPPSGAVLSTPSFPYANAVSGDAISKFRYSGPGAPDYTSVVESSSLGNAPGATLQISYEGAFEAVNSTPQNPAPDLATLKVTATGGGPILAANISELDGYPLIRFRVRVTFPPPPTTSPSAILPSVNDITINYDTAPGCP